MSVAAKTDDLLNLARSRAPADRERLLLAIVELCDAGESAAGLMTSKPIQGLLNSIFMSLVVEAERDIRRRLSEKLAQADWAPSALVNVLALDDIEIARPVIAGSPVLLQADQLRGQMEQAFSVMRMDGSWRRILARHLGEEVALRLSTP